MKSKEDHSDLKNICHLLIGSTLKGKNLLPLGGKFFRSKPGAVGRAPDLESQRSWVRYPVWPHTFVSLRAVVSYWRKYLHEVLANCLGGLSLPRKSVVRLTDHPDMTLDVYLGHKTTTQQQQHLGFKVVPCDTRFKPKHKKAIGISL